MKIKFLACYLLTIICLIACAKPICPEPVSVTTPIIVPIITTPTVDTTTPKPQRYVVTLQPGSEGKDVVINTNDPTLNYPSRTFLHARAWTSNGNEFVEKGIIQFDYSPIPAGAVITKATLTLFADTTIDIGSVGHSQLSGSNDWVLKRVTQAWDEFTVTWNTEPTTDLNNVIQCAASTSPSQAYHIDVTSWVADEIALPTSYYGFLMQLNNNTPYRAIAFCSSDHQFPSLRPKMVIEYTK